MPEGREGPSLRDQFAWVFFAIPIGVLVWVMWKWDSDETEDFFTRLVVNSYLKGVQDRVVKWTLEIKMSRILVESINSQTDLKLEFKEGYLIMPPEGEEIDPKSGALLFWCAPDLKRRVLREATRIARHRIKHFSTGALNKLLLDD